MTGETPLEALVRSELDKWRNEKESLVAKAMIETGLSPLDLVICEQRSLGGTRVWVEPQTQQMKDQRIAALNDENRALRAEIARLESRLLRHEGTPGR